MTAAELEAIRERAEKATPGPWTKVAAPGYGVVCVFKCSPPENHGMEATDEDEAFMAAARQDVPALLAEVAKLKALLREIEQTERYFPGCVLCGFQTYSRHAPECALAAALK